MRTHSPSAVDAQGQEIPVSLSVEGSRIRLHVDHQGGDIAFPILVDLIYEDWVTSCHGTPPPGQSDLGNCAYNQSWWHTDTRRG